MLFVSLHADPRVEYPYFLGYADELGAGAGVGFTHNYPLPHGTTWEAYGPALDDACAKVEAFRPDALVVSLGVDTYEHDPISQFRLRTEDFPKIGARIAAARVPTLVRDGGRLRRRGHRGECRERADRLRVSSGQAHCGGSGSIQLPRTRPRPIRGRSGTRSSGGTMSTILGNIRYGVRMLIRRPGLSASAVIALALGIGLTTTMFSIVYVAVKGLPFERADRLVAVFRNRPAQGVEFMGVSIHDFQDWRQQQTSFEDIAAYYPETVNVGGTEGQPIRYLGAYASAHLFDLLRVRPALGRTFRPEEDHPSTPPVMILSYRAWQDRFQGDPAIVGRTVRANAEITTIVGVMPEKFDFPGAMDAWLPLRIDPLAYSRSGGPAFESTQLQAIGRLKDGVTLEQAQAEMAAIAGRLATEYPDSNQGVGATVMRQADTFIGPDAVGMLYTMLAAVFGVLLIACANVANLLLARTVARSKEVAIRTALGANRIRTITQLLAEALVLAAAGAAVGLIVAKSGDGLLQRGAGHAGHAAVVRRQAGAGCPGLRRRPHGALDTSWPASSRPCAPRRRTSRKS